MGARRASLRLALLAALAVGVTSPGLAAADPAPESVVSSGTVASTSFQLSVSAGPYGQDPTGYLHLSGVYSFDATPTCMNMAGASTVFGFRIDDGQGAGAGFLVASGQQSFPSPPPPRMKAAVTQRAVIYEGLLRDPPTACPPPGTAPPPFLYSAGAGTISGTSSRSGGPVNPVPFQTLAFPAPAPGAIAQEADGTIWFLEPDANRLAAVPDDQSGQIKTYRVPTAAAGLSSIAPDLSGACSGFGCADPGMWFAEAAGNRIGHVTASGAVVEYPLPTAGAAPSSIAGDLPHGGAWFTEPGADKVGHISENGSVTEYALPTPAADPVAISADLGTAGSAGDGAWFVEKAADKLGYIDALGHITEYPLPTAGAAPSTIATDASQLGAPGAWFGESGANQLGHIDAGGAIHEYPIPTPGSGADGLSVGPGPDGSPGGAWFSEPAAGQFGYISASGQVKEFTVPDAGPHELVLAATLAAPPLSGYTTSEALWWTDAARGEVGFARFPLASGAATPIVGGLPLKGPPPIFRPLAFGRRVIVHAWGVELTLRCQRARPCRGRAQLRVMSRRGTLLALARFRIRGHHSQTVRLHFNLPALELLADHRAPLSAILSARLRRSRVRESLPVLLPGRVGAHVIRPARPPATPTTSNLKSIF